MAVNVKMGVDIGGFTSGIKQGQQILKGLNAEMKASEAEFKATGNAEQKLNSQTKTLNSQLNVQKGIADQARQALKTMTDQGIDPADAAYQKMYVTLMNAEAGANDALAALNALKNGSESAADGAEKLSDSLGDIKNKMSLEQVRSGIDSITKGLESAAQKAIQLGEQIWNAVMDKAQWADDTATMAQMFGIDLEEFLKMQALVEDGHDTSVEAILKSQKKLRKGIGEETKGTMDTLKELGLAVETIANKNRGGGFELVTDDSLDLMFRAGQAIMALKDDYEKEAKAQDLFGRSWEELVPLFTKYKTLEEYKDALEDVNTASEEDVNALAELNDKVATLEHDLDVLGTKILATLAPALTDAATALDGLLSRVLEYLETDEGQQALDDLGKAVSGLFDDLGKIDPQDVVSGFTEVFNTVVGGVQWLTDHWEDVVAAMEGIIGGWAVLRITGGILDVVKIVSGLQTLTGASSAAAGATAGASWGSAFAGAVMKAAPWLLFLYETLKPNENTHDELGNSELTDKNGNLTDEAKAYGYTEEYAEETKQIKDRYDAVRKLTGLTDQQRNALQGFWSVWKDIADMQDQGMDIPQHRMDAYNLYGQQLQTLFEGQETQLSMYMKKMQELYASGERGNMLDLTFFNIDKDGAQIMVSLQAPEDAVEQLEEQVGTAEINCVVHFVDENGNNIGVDFGDEKGEYIGGHGKRRKKANGIWSVPYDNYLAYLHKGERVMTAREVQSRSYNSNLYVESMYMNGGTDAAGLAAAMAAAQRRQMSGYGS